MIKVRRGKGGEESLRPLTEKDIQKKLYGAYSESIEVQEKPEETKWFPHSQKNKRKATLPHWKISLPPLPWKKFISVFWSGLRSILNFSILLLGKIPTRLGIGFFSIIVIFLAVHALNAYRTAAMKAPAPSLAEQEVQPVVNEAQEEPEPGRVGTPPAVTAPIITQKAVKKFPVSTGASIGRKPYVIQVATYANSNDAERLAQELKEARFVAFVQPFNRQNGKTFYLVFLGRFKSFQEAEAKYKEFHEKPVAKNFKDSFIRML